LDLIGGKNQEYSTTAVLIRPFSVKSPRRSLHLFQPGLTTHLPNQRSSNYGRNKLDILDIGQHLGNSNSSQYRRCSNTSEHFAPRRKRGIPSPHSPVVTTFDLQPSAAFHASTGYKWIEADLAIKAPAALFTSLLQHLRCSQRFARLPRSTSRLFEQKELACTALWTPPPSCM
jgi:hypothetical protein